VGDGIDDDVWEKGGQQKYPNIELDGVPESCYNGAFNGQWTYVGQTADGRPYYKFFNDAYMFYDKDCDAGAGGITKPYWYIDSIKPSTSAEQALDGTGKCLSFWHTAQSTTTTSPPSGEWMLTCGGAALTALKLTLTPNCPPKPDYTYMWGKWDTPQDGTACGGQNQRQEIESCAALPTCACTNRRQTETQTQNQAACTTIPTTITATTSTTSTSNTTTTSSETTTTTTITTSTLTTTSTTTIYDAGNVDCVEKEDACTAACQTAADRNYAVLTPVNKLGKACSGPTDCPPGEGGCPATNTPIPGGSGVTVAVNNNTPSNRVDTNADDTSTHHDPTAAGTSADDNTKSSPIGVIVGVGAFVIIALLLLLFYKQKSNLLDQIRAAAPPLANAVHNPAFADPNQQLPYGGDEVGVPPVPARAVAGANVHPVQSMYEEADLKRAPIYDAGRLAGAASHTLRDQRRKSQLVGAAAPPENEGYEEIAEGTAGTPAGDDFDDDNELDC
jgi:hypothetical protein